MAAGRARSRTVHRALSGRRRPATGRFIADRRTANHFHSRWGWLPEGPAPDRDGAGGRVCVHVLSSAGARGQGRQAWRRGQPYAVPAGAGHGPGDSAGGSAACWSGQFSNAGGLVFGRRPETRAGRGRRICIGLGIFAVLGAIGLAVKSHSDVFPGDTLGAWGLGPIERMNAAGKASPFTPALFVMIQAGAIAGAIAVFVWRAWEWLGEGGAKEAAVPRASDAGRAP